MEPAWTVTLAVLAAALPTVLLALIIYSYCKRVWRRYFALEPLEPVAIDRRDAALKRSALMASLWRSSIPLRAFQWSEHPSHVITALEHGWGAFAFSYAASTMWEMWETCSACSAMKFPPPEITWTESSIQQIRLNPGLQSNRDGCVLPVQALQSALPLPGPVLGPYPYPQEAYFEVSVVDEASSERSSLAGSERVKLIAQSLSTSERYLTEVDVDGDDSKDDDAAAVEKGDQVDWDELLSVGLAGADAPPFRLLGFDPGSVGFLSADGQCYVNGTPHTTQGKEPQQQQQRRPWRAGPKTTVGCGFDPRVKRVFFTVNGEVVHEAWLKGADFGNPLYPTVASNYDVTVVVNLGQRAFEYAGANATRVSNPCCRILQTRPGAGTRKSASFFDDDMSTDLFSMGRLESHWLADVEHRHEADSDLFEIVLDGGNALKR